MIRPSRTARAAVVSRGVGAAVDRLRQRQQIAVQPDNTTTTTNTRPSSPTDSTTPPPTASPLLYGELFPETGDLAYLGPPQFAGADLAIKDINAAGGVLGKPVVGTEG